jgi:ABC-type polysaccharide/polyol phosphate export permease
MKLIIMKNYLDFVFAMTEKEIKARYKNTVFGFLWVIVNPLLQMFVIGFVFRFFIKEPIANYYLYLLVGLLVWNFFSLSLNKVTPSIVNERSLIKKAFFPREAIPLSIIFSNFVHLMVAFMILLVPAIYLGILSINNFPRLILGIVLLLVFTIGFGLLVSSLNVKYRDINFFVQAILIIWFYATPIIYSINVIPRNLIWIWRLNPLTVIVQLFQNALINSPPPGPAMLASNLVIIVVIAYLGISIFIKESKNFDDWL